MKKTNIFAEYITPTLELCYTPVESGFAATGIGTGRGSIDDGTEEDWGTL